MLEIIFSKISLAVVGLAIMIAGVFGYNLSINNLGATVPISVAIFETTLASKITSEATSMTLTAASTTAGGSLTGYFCFTIDEGSADVEFVCGTAASTTAITSMIRGIDPIDGDKEVTALKKAHRRGATIKITNYPQDAIVSRIINGDETFPIALSYATSVSTTSFSSAWNIVNRGYADNLVIAGGTIGNWTQNGIYRLATTSELTAGTATTTGGYYLIPPNIFFSTSSSATTLVPVTNTSGKLSQGFIDLTGNFVWTGTHSFASTTIGNTLAVTGTSTFGGNSIFSGTFTAASTTINNTLTVTGTSTFTGTTTFSAIPTLPASDPTSDNQAARKIYVDNAAGPTIFIVSDNLRKSADTERNTASTTYNKMKEIRSPGNGSLRIKFDMKSGQAGTNAYGKTYVNGVATGTERITSTGSYVTYSEDISGFKVEDLVQVYIYTGNAIYPAYITNFRIYADASSFIVIID